MKKTKRTTEELLIELESRFGNPLGPVEFKVVVEAIEHLKELVDLKTVKMSKE